MDRWDLWQRLQGGYVLDALGYPRWLPRPRYDAWMEEAHEAMRATGWNRLCVGKTTVGEVTVSTVFIPHLALAERPPFETWVDAPGSEGEFYRWATAQQAYAAHWCLVWQLWLQAKEG